MNDNIYIFKSTKRNDKMNNILREIQGATAEQILCKYNRELKPPIQIENILKEIGISVIGQDFGEVEKLSGFERGSVLGAAISNGNDLGIFYKEGDSKNQIRFTLAHELAHCCLDIEMEEISHLELRTKENKNDEKEMKANEFAGRLLIPEKSLRKVYDKFLIPSLTKLAEIFEVNVSVMETRLNYLELSYYNDANVKIN